MSCRVVHECVYIRAASTAVCPQCTGEALDLILPRSLTHSRNHDNKPDGFCTILAASTTSGAVVHAARVNQNNDDDSRRLRMLLRVCTVDARPWFDWCGAST